MKIILFTLTALLLAPSTTLQAGDNENVPANVVRAAVSQKMEANRVAEILFESEKRYQNPFMEVELDAIITQPDGAQLRVPGSGPAATAGTFVMHPLRRDCTPGGASVLIKTIRGCMDLQERLI